MCFAIPGRVLEVSDKKSLVNFNGIKKEVNTEFLHVKRNDYVLVFNGYAIEIIDKERAKEISKELEEIANV
jgi:hydrogenase expression/formation protein HypC